MNITVLKPSGFCNGVSKTIKIIDDALKSSTYQKIYVIGKLIHNNEVINHYKSLGVIFFDMDENTLNNMTIITTKDLVIFSCDGHKKEYEKYLNAKGINYLDGICYNVNKLYTFIDFYKNKYPIIFVGKKGHEEMIVATSYNNVYFYDIKSNDNDFSSIKSNTVLLTFQTTLSNKDMENAINKITKMFNEVIINNSLCGNVLERIENVKKIPDNATKILIIGCTSSSNTDEIYKAAKTSHNCEVYKINDISDIDFSINSNDEIYITSGCSGSMDTINKIIDYINKMS